MNKLAAIALVGMVSAVAMTSANAASERSYLYEDCIKDVGCSIVSEAPGLADCLKKADAKDSANIPEGEIPDEYITPAANKCFIKAKEYWIAETIKAYEVVSGMTDSKGKARIEDAMKAFEDYGKSMRKLPADLYVGNAIYDEETMRNMREAELMRHFYLMIAYPLGFM